MIKYKNVKTIEVQDLDQLVEETYGRPYSFQQQDGCKDRGSHHFTVPSKYADDENMHDSIPEKINGEVMGVKFQTWLERDPKKPVDERDDWAISLFWERNFYPDFDTLVNDLHKKGLIEDGEYTINIDW